jgi:hypothetical protein
MRHLKKINEKFIHNWRSKEALISEIWDISEDDIFDAFSDIEDEFDVEIKCTFVLRSPKGHNFTLEADNDELIEGYGAAGFKPIIQILIKTADYDNGIVSNLYDIREIQSVMMDCLKNIDGYAMSDVSKTKRSISLELVQEGTYGEKEVSLKSGYHRKSNINFTTYTTAFKQKGYKVIVNKIFEKDGKYYIKLPTGPIWNPEHPVRNATKKLYSIMMEKVYAPDFNLIEEVHELKGVFESTLTTIIDTNDFFDVSYDFELTTKDVATVGLASRDNIKVIFSISAYES